MEYKQDWNKAKERFYAFWENEIIDRCCIAVTAPAKNSEWSYYREHLDVERFDDNDTESIEKWWRDVEENVKRNEWIFQNTFYGGEAFPIAFTNWGATAQAGFYGGKPVFNKKSVWYHEFIDDLSEWTWNFDKENNEYCRDTFEITKAFAQNSNGKYMAGMPELGNAGDILSLIRGMGQVCLDMIDCPDVLKNAIQIISDDFIELQDELFEIIKGTNDGGGILPWMDLWMPGKHGNQLACDISCVISTDSFKEFFVPHITKEALWSNFGTFHLDGPDCMRTHLDTLLQMDCIKAIEWTPGEGSPPTTYPQYIPQYKKIQEAGKKLILLAKPYEVETILQNLSPKGLLLKVQSQSEDEARELLKKAEKWSAAGM